MEIYNLFLEAYTKFIFSKVAVSVKSIHFCEVMFMKVRNIVHSCVKIL